MRPLIALMTLIVTCINAGTSPANATELSIDGGDTARFVYLLALLILTGSAVFTSGWRSMGENIRALGFWVIALLVLVGLYSFRYEFKSAGLRLAGTLIPGFTSEQAGSLVVSRDRSGMFAVSGAVNNVDVRFLFDTGASAVVLTMDDAKRAGLTPKAEDFTVSTSTANGPAKVAPVILATLAVGSIRQSRIRAFVAQEGALNTSLLGHTFLNGLESYQVRGDQLILKAP